jgi:hypothetical protein
MDGTGPVSERGKSEKFLMTDEGNFFLKKIDHVAFNSDNTTFLGVIFTVEFHDAYLSE